MEGKGSALEALSREELIELIGIYSKNWLAMDGFWFQSVERKLGMDEAMFHDVEIWKRFTVTEAKRIKAFLKLEEHPGLEGLAKALPLRFYGNINDDTIDDRIRCRCLSCYPEITDTDCCCKWEFRIGPGGK